MKAFGKAVLLAAIVMVSTGVWAAKKWGLPEEEIATFEAKVVDVLCELTGDCPANCGDGKRQLGLLNGEGKLILPVKNSSSAIFAGSTDDLIDYCGTTVIADGLFTTNRGYTVFQLQNFKEKPEDEFQRANRFLAKWAERNGAEPGSKQAKRWFRNDPRVNEILAEKGKLGLGLDVDEDYLKSLE